MSSFKKKVEKSYDRTSNTYNDFMKYDVENQSIARALRFELFKKMNSASTSIGFKRTRYDIYAYGRK